MRDAIPIKYGEFYDVPRQIRFECRGRWYYLESRFEGDLDDYRDEYDVYVLPYRSEEEIQQHPRYWCELRIEDRLGRIGIRDVGLDETRRKSIDGAAFENWLRSNWTVRLETWIRAACLLEATARKPGNVHPEASFVDLEYADFVCSAEAAASPLAHAAETGVGRAVLAAIEATRQRTPRNTNLGIALLIAPLAAVPAGIRLREGIEAVLAGLSLEDADEVYQAIRLAQPGGMGRVEDQDISEAPQVTLREAMRMAADRDAIAAQYAGRFELVLEFGLPWLAANFDFTSDWETLVIGLQLALLCRQSDTLIARKCGLDTAREASERAEAVLDAGWPATETGSHALAVFDDWLRADGHRRNPGTTADLVAACLFAAFRDGIIAVPDLSSIRG